jgi:hypothetical protein
MQAPNIFFIIVNKVLVAFFIPNGMIVQSNDPKLVMRGDYKYLLEPFKFAKI